jgi:beta-fructofuranosidase
MKPRSIARRDFLTALGLGATAMALPRRVQGLALASAAVDLAHDADRPEYHFIAPRNWMNDPNRPILWKGKYHRFYQWAPDSAAGGPPHWGHAISADMVHWRHLPIALAPTPGGADRDGCWTGSAVVRDGVPTVIYTGVIHQLEERGTDKEWRQAQMLATAEDEGLLHWKKVAEPVVAAPPEGMIATGFRDPCPWREADGWYLVVGSGKRDKGGCVLLYRSQDLRHWEFLHPLVHGQPTANAAPDSVDRGDMWECPDFFEVNGQHCLLYSSENKVSWSTGEYDRKEHRFTIKRQGLIDHGGIAYYAPKSFSAQDGRRVLWGGYERGGHRLSLLRRAGRGRFRFRVC